MRAAALRRTLSTPRAVRPALGGGFQASSLRRGPASCCAPAACTRLYSSHTGSAPKSENPDEEAPTNESLQEELERVASKPQTSVSLKATLDTGLGLLLRDGDDSSGMNLRQRTLLQIATFLKRELPVRLARRVIELKARFALVPFAKHTRSPAQTRPSLMRTHPCLPHSRPRRGGSLRRAG